MLKKKKLVVGNWKMNIGTIAEAKKLVSGVKKKTATIKRTDVVFCPPFVYLSDLKKSVGKKTFLGAQNVFTEDKGSYTGEVSAVQVKAAGASYAIVGHSERRKMGETDEQVNKKVLAVLRAGMSPIVCVGEQVHDEDGGYLDMVKGQLAKALTGVTKSQISDVVIAYEPVWAIGATTAMSPRDIHEMTLYIKKCLRDVFGSYGNSTQVLYGGAVNTANIEEIIRDGHVDGVLVGRDSLEADNFAEIITIVDSVK